MARMDLTRWTPYAELQLMRDLLNSAEWRGQNANAPAIAVDAWREEGELVIAADIPGVDKDDVKLTVRQGVLVIEAERRVERTVDETAYFLHEVRSGTMRRSLRLPQDVDTSKAEAVHRNGQLTVRFPTATPDQGKRVEVQEG